MKFSKKFALIGAAGYVAPKHIKAIYNTGNSIVAALDKSDSVGILDSYSYDVAFFTEFERFDRHAEKLKRKGDSGKIHYVSICSPNYLHDSHIRFALRIGADAICEKPLVLNPWNLDALTEIEKETGRSIYNILQLRVHPSIIKLKQKIENYSSDKKHNIILTYITSRGNWYYNSWKGVKEKSGGIASNIGIHFFDMLIWIFGEVKFREVHLSSDGKMSGFIELEKANVRWFLSIDRNDLPDFIIKNNMTTYRSILLDDKEIEFSGGFADLHTLVYKDILEGGGFGIKDVRPSIEIVSDIRNLKPVTNSQFEHHPFVV